MVVVVVKQAENTPQRRETLIGLVLEATVHLSVVEMWAFVVLLFLKKEMYLEIWE